MSLNKNAENMKYDNRLLDINLKLGLLTKEEYEQHLKSLKDVEAESEKIDIEEQNSSN